jgi:uncharacterized protein
MSRYFLDLSFAIAAKLKRDQRHGDVAKLRPKLMHGGAQITTTAFVFNEITTYLNARGKHATAVDIGRILMTSPQVELVQIDDGLFLAGWDYFVCHDDKRYSLTDCISFLVMHERGLRQALTFDQRFAQAGFERLPSK